MTQQERIISEAQWVEKELREIGEHHKADIIRRLIRSRIQSRSENQRISKEYRELHRKYRFLTTEPDTSDIPEVDETFFKKARREKLKLKLEEND